MAEPETGPDEKSQFERSSLYRITLVTLFGMTALAFVIASLRGMSLPEFFFSPKNVLFQLGAGGLLGLLAGVAMTLLVLHVKFFAPVREIGSEMVRLLNPTLLDCLVLSLCAGWGEELLFRGALQPWIGFVAASALFALAHGITPRLTKGVLIYVSAVFVIGLGLGIVYERVGIFAAMSAHACYDMTALLITRKTLSRGSETDSQDGEN